MAKRCQISGKGPSTGHNVSHSNRHTKRRFLPNLQKTKVWDPEKKRYVTMRISAKALRTLNKPLTKREEARLTRKMEE